MSLMHEAQPPRNRASAWEVLARTERYRARVLPRRTPHGGQPSEGRRGGDPPQEVPMRFEKRFRPRGSTRRSPADLRDVVGWSHSTTRQRLANRDYMASKGCCPQSSPANSSESHKLVQNDRRRSRRATRRANSSPPPVSLECAGMRSTRSACFRARARPAPMFLALLLQDSATECPVPTRAYALFFFFFFFFCEEPGSVFVGEVVREGTERHGKSSYRRRRRRRELEGHRPEREERESGKLARVRRMR